MGEREPGGGRSSVVEDLRSLVCQVPKCRDPPTVMIQTLTGLRATGGCLLLTGRHAGEPSGQQVAFRKGLDTAEGLLGTADWGRGRGGSFSRSEVDPEGARCWGRLVLRAGRDPSALARRSSKEEGAAQWVPRRGAGGQGSQTRSGARMGSRARGRAGLGVRNSPPPLSGSTAKTRRRPSMARLPAPTRRPGRGLQPHRAIPASAPSPRRRAAEPKQPKPAGRGPGLSPRGAGRAGEGPAGARAGGPTGRAEARDPLSFGPRAPSAFAPN